ncbi:MAG TPA: RNA methyltransferase [Flavipsychrobacter sp.]|nr:RNA methyltransferase [Flavipsychrobacter sp.]
MFVKKSMDELERKPAEEAIRSEKHKIIVILDDIRSMHNVGSVFRTSDAFAVESIFLCGFTPTPPHRDINKTALGATESVNWNYYETTASAVEAAKMMGYKVYAVEQVHDSMALNHPNLEKDKIALIFGNEVTGVNKEVLNKVNGCIEIPQWGAKHSLNISVSVGVLLWEMVRDNT